MEISRRAIKPFYRRKTACLPERGASRVTIWGNNSGAQPQTLGKFRGVAGEISKTVSLQKGLSPILGFSFRQASNDIQHGDSGSVFVHFDDFDLRSILSSLWI